jgi:cell division septum initiation protein DivIVA
LPSQKPASEEQRPAAAEATAPAEPTQVSADQLPRALFGYDRSTIVELLDTMSERIRSLVQERTEREHRIEELEREAERSRESHRLIGETLVSARDEANSIREEARRSAETALRSARERAGDIEKEAERTAAAHTTKILHAAQREKNQLLQEARQEGEQLLERARQEREQLLELARQERQEILDEAGRARAFVEETHEQLSDFLMAAVKWYERVKPEAVEPQAAEPQTPPPAAEPEATEPQTPLPAADPEAAEPQTPPPAPVPEAPIPAKDLSSIPSA